MKKLFLLSAAAILISTGAFAQSTVVTTTGTGHAAAVQIEPEYRTKIKSYVTEHRVRPVTTKEKIIVGATDAKIVAQRKSHPYGLSKIIIRRRSAGTGRPRFVKAHPAGPARSSGHGNDVAADRLRGRNCSARDQLGGEATVDFLPRGVVCTVICTLDEAR